MPEILGEMASHFKSPVENLLYWEYCFVLGNVGFCWQRMWFASTLENEDVFFAAEGLTAKRRVSLALCWYFILKGKYTHIHYVLCRLYKDHIYSYVEIASVRICIWTGYRWGWGRSGLENTKLNDKDFYTTATTIFLPHVSAETFSLEINPKFNQNGKSQ